MRDAAVVGTPSVQNRSLTATGMPSIGPFASPSARRLSDSFARFSAISGVSVMKALRPRAFSIAAR